MKHAGRITAPINTGHALIGSDAHYWPGKASTAHRAFVKFIKDVKPAYVIMNGDVIDAASISRHPPIGWESAPTVKQELDVAQERLAEIVAASAAINIWNLGNHDARFETRLATVAPEYAEVFGVHLKDHFPNWIPAWSVEIGGKKGAIVKHRFKGGQHAAVNNALWSGRSTVTGHLHRLSVTPVTDYSGDRFGVEGGILSETNGPQFVGYTEDNPLNWQSGFVLLTFHKGRLLYPEVIHVVKPGIVEFRGQLITV